MLLNMSIGNGRKKEKPGIEEAGGHTLPRHPAAGAEGFPEAEHLREGRGTRGVRTLGASQKGQPYAAPSGISVLLRIRVKGQAVVFPGRTPGISTGKHAPLTLQGSQALTLEKLLVCSLL